MIVFKKSTFNLISYELLKTPEQLQKPLGNLHEGFEALLGKAEELQKEILLGRELVEKEIGISVPIEMREEAAGIIHKSKIRDEAVQVAAMAVRIIQELT
jgi:hypothetical protein